MKSSHRFVALICLLAGTESLLAQGTGELDLTTLYNYAGQTRPSYITKNNTPANNQISNAGATLGRVLFYDKRLSRDNTISCASCHKQAHAFSDSATASAGVNGTTGRHGMRLINERFGTEAKFFWDERAASLEAQTSQPIQNHVEMGFSGTSGDPAFADLVTKLSAISEYRVLFSLTFGGTTINETLVQRALAQFVRSIQSFDSKYDTGRAAATNDNQNFGNFSAAENAGKQLFLAGPGQGGAGCAACHRPPEFDIDPNSRNNGVTAAIGGGTDLTNTRSPSLRDLIGPGGVPNGGFMHNGVFTTLDQVVNHYNAIPADNTNLDPRLRRPGGVQNLNLTQTQRNNLAAFLNTLTGTAVYTDAKWSDPFNASNQLTLIILPTTSMTVQNNGNGTITIACNSVPGFQYRLESSTNLSTWTPGSTVTPDAAGKLQQTVAGTSGTFYRFSYTPP